MYDNFGLLAPANAGRINCATTSFSRPFGATRHISISAWGKEIAKSDNRKIPE
jgi:hypothetical protein